MERQPIPGSASNLVKVAFVIEEPGKTGARVETMWAEPLDAPLFRLCNSPFYAFGFSFLDVVEALPGDDPGLPLVRRNVRPSGHSTYRLIVPNGVARNPFFERFWKPLENHACTYEGATATYVAVDVPDSADIREVYRLLEIGEAEGAWDFEEAHVGHRL